MGAALGLIDWVSELLWLGFVLLLFGAGGVTTFCVVTSLAVESVARRVFW